MKLSIVVPAYNEESRLGAMLDAYMAYFLPRYGEEVEIIVVVNGSSDRTAEIADARVRQDARVRVLVEPRKVGKGGAVRIGFEHATGMWVGFVDADAATPPPSFEDLLLKANGADVVVASRWMRGSVVDPPQPLSRRIASRMFNLLVGFLFQWRLHDTQCGAKLFRREKLMVVLPRLGITRWAFDVDLLFQLRRTGCRIIEIPTVWSDQAGSRLKVSLASMEMFAAVVRLRLIYSPFRWVVDVFNYTLGRFIKYDF